MNRSFLVSLLILAAILFASTAWARDRHHRHRRPSVVVTRPPIVFGSGRRAPTVVVVPQTRHRAPSVVVIPDRRPPPAVIVHRPYHW